MSESSAVIVEHSEPFIHELIQNRAETGWEGVTTADLVSDFAIPTLLCDPRGKATQLIIIAGGAASGKSTLAENIAHELADRGTTSAIISSDDFVRWDRGERHRRETAGMSPEDKYDFFEMRRAIGAICANQDFDRSIEVPQYDPHTGLAIDGEHRRRIPKIDVLIAEGDMMGGQGVLPQDLYPNHTFKPLSLYVHVPDEVRLARRVERDLLKRNAQGATPQDIANSFERRQTMQHLPYTLTYAAAADVILTPPAERTSNGAHAYDMYLM